MCYNGYEPDEASHEWLYDCVNDYYELSPREIAPDCKEEEILRLPETFERVFRQNRRSLFISGIKVKLSQGGQDDEHGCVI